MLAAFSSKDLEKKPSRRIELFQAIFPTNISSQYARSVPCKKKKKKKKKAKQAGSSGKSVGEKAKSRPRGRGVMNSLFSRLPHLCFKARLTTGSPSSGCEMIIFHHRQILNKITSPYFHSASLRFTRSTTHKRRASLMISKPRNG